MTPPLARLATWLIEPMDAGVLAAVERLRHAPDMQHVAIMPDVHTAADVCVGTVAGTSHRIYPQIVGGDIGCGMLSVALDVQADRLADPVAAGRLLAAFPLAAPTARRHRHFAIAFPAEIADLRLSHGQLEAVCRDDGRLQFGTLGGGNHFVEFQADESDGLWLTIHSGSRAMGQAIRAHHIAQAQPVGRGLMTLDAREEAGQAYLQDVVWARRYADANRRAIAQCVADAIEQVLGAGLLWETLICVDHNHVVLEEHGGRRLWVHRKGAMPAGTGAAGILPGSMGGPSYHVEGRGCEESLCSSAHGAGRALSREAARQRISERAVHRQMEGIWYDYRMARTLREEAPGSYKDIRSVLRAQHELVKVTRVLRPVLNYKGR